MEAFTNALLRAIQIAQDECGIRQPRLRQAVQEYGGFDALARAGRLELSLEALAVSAKFNALFTDAEVNACFELLCGAGYYERKK